MTKATIIALLLAISACVTSSRPDSGARSYVLVAVDGQPPPTTVEQPDGYRLVSESLAFSDLQIPVARPRADATRAGSLWITRATQAPDRQIQYTSTEYPYGISGARIRISLCPVGAPCVAIVNELAGELTRSGDLTLTHFLGGQPGAIYRFRLLPNLPG